MVDDHDHGLLGSEALDTFDQDDLERELLSTASKSSSASTRLPRCAVLNFKKVGDCVNMRPLAVTDTAGIAARIRSNDHSSFMLEEHSSRALNFTVPRVSDTAPLSFRTDAVGNWRSQNARATSLESDVGDSFSSLVISASEATGGSEDSSVSSGKTGSLDRGSKASNVVERRQGDSHHESAKTCSGWKASKPSKTAPRSNGSRSKTRSRMKRLSREKSAMSRLLAFLTRRNPSKNEPAVSSKKVPSSSTKKASADRREKLTPGSSVSSMEIPSQLFEKPRKSGKSPHAKPQSAKTGSTSCFPYPLGDEKESKSFGVNTSEANDNSDAFDSFYLHRKRSQRKVGRPRGASHV